MIGPGILICLLFLLVVFFPILTFLSDYASPVVRASIVSMASEGFSATIGALAGAFATMFLSRRK